MADRQRADVEGVFAFIAEHTSDVIVRIRADGVLTYVSPAVRRYGYEPCDIINGSFGPLIHPDDAARLAHNNEALLRGDLDPLADRVHRFRTASGDWVWMEGNPQVVRDAEGRVVEVVNIFRDVTHRRALEEKAQAQAGQFEAAFRHAAIGMALVGLDGSFLRINEAFCRITGRPEAEMLALDFQTITHPDDLDKDLGLLQQLTVGEIDSYRMDKRYFRKDGEEVWVHLSVSMVRNADGTPKHYVAQVEDQTDRRAAETALRASEARYRVLAEASEDVTVQLDLRGTITYVSPAARAYGYEPEALVGSLMVEMVHPEDADRARGNFAAIAVGDVPTPRERQVRIRTTDGAWVWMEGNAQLLRDAAGAPAGFVTTLRNVTERREQEALFEAAFEHAALGKCIVSMDGRVLRANKAACQILAYDKADLEQRNVYDVLDAQDREEEKARRLLAGEVESYQTTRRCRRADGTSLWAQVTVGLVRYADGRPKHIVCEFEDLTERHAAEAALKASEERYRLIAENMSDMIFVAGLDGRSTYASPSVRRHGVEPEQIVGSPVEDSVHPEDLPRMREVFDEVARGAEGLRVRWRGLNRATGEWAWLESSPSLLRDPDTGEPKGFLDVVRDVSAQVAQEEALAEATAALQVSETRYRMIAENTSDMIVMSDLNGRATYVSQAVRRAGRRPEEIAGRSFAESVHPDDLAHLSACFRKLLKGERVERIRWRGRDAVRGWAWLESNPSLVCDPVTGEPTGFLDVIRDVQVQVEQEEALARATAALQESEARYRLIGDSTSDIIVMAEPNGRITFISPSAAMIGYTPEELIGAAFIKQMHPDDLQRVWPSVKDLAPGETAPRMRWRAQHKITGEWVWLESQPTMLKDPQTGGRGGFLDVVRDVTHQVRQEEALARARAEAEAAAAAKSQFLANMSHEIRTPLTAVLGFTSLLSEMPDLPETAAGYVERIAGAGKGLLAIVNDILDFSKLEAGKFEIRPRPTDVAALAEETLMLFSNQADAKGLSLAFEARPGLPRMAMLDGDRLRQTLINLIGNAIKFTEAGKVTVTVSPNAGEQVAIAVTDTGPGLDEQAQARLFQRFSQVDDSMTRRHGGTGLGLAICKGIAEAMGGSIGVESEPGAGATFCVVLPAPAVDAAADLAREETPLSIDGTRVFLVDDNATNRELARRILEAAGAEVQEASDGEEAVERLGLLPVDVVLMDLRMPKLDGRGALARLRAAPGPNQTAPVLAFTADADLAGDGDLDGFDGLVRKPIQPMELYGAIAAATQWLPQDEDMTYAAG